MNTRPSLHMTSYWNPSVRAKVLIADTYIPMPKGVHSIQPVACYTGSSQERRIDPPHRDELSELTRRVALSRNLDFLAADDPGIPILTVHQSKGLEFDTVFVASLTEDEFPSYYAKKEGKLEEEKRLFYVAITRAKRYLILPSHATNDNGYDKPLIS
jgi:superfamily I DNA/RNA helicase